MTVRIRFMAMNVKLLMSSVPYKSCSVLAALDRCEMAAFCWRDDYIGTMLYGDVCWTYIAGIQARYRENSVGHASWLHLDKTRDLPSQDIWSHMTDLNRRPPDVLKPVLYQAELMRPFSIQASLA